MQTALNLMFMGKMSSTLLYAVVHKAAANESVYVTKLQYIYASINAFRAPSSGL
jgi:hypothetical protein